PDWEPPEALREGLHTYADATPGEFQYQASVGLPELREEIAARRGVERSQVIITNGTGEANHLAMTEGYRTMPGEEILLVDPVYPYYAGRASMIGAEASYVPVDETGHLDPDTVAEYAGAETSVIPNRIVTNAVSKSMAITGWRVGYAVFPHPEGPNGQLMERARTRHMLTNVTGSRPAQTAVLHALRNTGPEYYEATRELLTDRIAAVTAALDDVGAEYTEPEGAFYVMARFPEFPGTFENVERMIDEAGVAGMPGEAFGESRAEWIRFALVPPRVETAAERLEAFFRK
ncbi:pyridoxal phosphate-dependent aminotransferase, partial [Halobacteriales archaeon QH_7_66_37]